MRRWTHGDWTVVVHGWSMSRPHFSAGWLDTRCGWVALSWGTPGADPVWLIERAVVLADDGWLGDLIDRWYARRYPALWDEKT